MNWLVNKLRGGRISLTIKELKYDIDNALNARRATILFKAQVYRCQLMSRTGIDVDVFRNPQNHPREVIMELVGGLEDVIFSGEKQVKATAAHIRGLGMDGGQLKSMMLINKRAVQVWIASLGALEKHDTSVKEIWRQMLSSRASLSPADSTDPEEAVQMKLMTEETLSFVPTKYQ